MPFVTRLRELRGGRVAVDLDGRRWRTFAPEVVVQARLIAGEELHRPRLRELARARRQVRALEVAMRSVARRDQSVAELRRRLERRRVAATERERAVERLSETGLLDDGRYALRRAESLAERGHGDDAIRWQLTRAGVAEDAAERAIAALTPELERAQRLAGVRGRGPRTARELARRGFAEDVVAAVASGVAEEA